MAKQKKGQSRPRKKRKLARRNPDPEPRRRNPVARQPLSSIMHEIGLTHRDSTISVALVERLANLLKTFGVTVRYNVETGEPVLTRKAEIERATTCLSALKDTISCVLAPSGLADSWFAGCGPTAPAPALRRNPEVNELDCVGPDAEDSEIDDDLYDDLEDDEEDED